MNAQNISKLLNRDVSLFNNDIVNTTATLKDIIESSSFLVIGGAGSIGSSVTKQLFLRKANLLHVIDISENNLVELVRDIRSSYGYTTKNFATFALDVNSNQFKHFKNFNTSYDYVLNLSALKHVRSEKDIFTLSRLIETNIFTSIDLINFAKKCNAKNFFCVSTDKAANPVNMMGASKRIMELYMMRESFDQNVSMSRFANVAFSDGSLLHGFSQRFEKNQPIAAPHDVKRYFVTPEESGQLCLLSCLLAKNREIFFPKLSEKLDLIKFSDLAVSFLQQRGYDPYICSSEEEAREKSQELIKNKKWPCYFFKSDTTGEKDCEEFYTQNETIDLNKYQSIGIISNNPSYNEDSLRNFELKYFDLINNDKLTKKDLVDLFTTTLDFFNHNEKDKFLDQRM